MLLSVFTSATETTWCAGRYSARQITGTENKDSHLPERKSLFHRLQDWETLTPHTDKSGSNVNVPTQLRPLPAHGRVPRSLTGAVHAEVSLSFSGIQIINESFACS